MYKYKAKLVRVVDGDTADVMIDLGFDTWVKARLRFKGVDTWEKRTRDKAEKKTGETPLSKRGLNNFFTSNSMVGQSSPSPYTKKSIDYVLSTTKDNLNKLVTVKANVKKDFKKFHDLDVNELDGLAIMADTDNSKMKSVSYFQNIYFSEN